MGKGAPLRWLENRILGRYFHGKGIEIGALWRRFPLPVRARAWYVDRLDPVNLDQQYAELKGAIVKPHIIADASQLPFAVASLNFIIASHVLEHMPFPLSALRHWYEILAPGGALLLRIPNKRYTFDVLRARTSLQHLLEEEAQPERFDRRLHFADWVQNVSGRSPGTAEFEGELRDLIQMDYSIHYHVWIDADVQELINFTRSSWNLRWQAVVFWGAHFYRKETVALLMRE